MPTIYNSSVAIVEVVFVLAVLADISEIQDAVTHLTWWGLFGVGIYDICVILESLFSVRLPSRVWFIVVSLEIVIILGVLIMSTLSCDLLYFTHAEYGSLAYGVGNYLMHYLPINRLIYGRPQALRCFHEQIIETSTIIVIYVCLLHPEEIYGCPLPRQVIALIMWATVIVVGVFIDHFCAKELT